MQWEEINCSGLYVGRKGKDNILQILYDWFQGSGDMMKMIGDKLEQGLCQDSEAATLNNDTVST